ncbi:MAG: hypothetical protein JXB13_18820 [Phycisphaerae bacterium]|nr:hypothetical protein [Phycisphaerae bacterium]
MARQPLRARYAGLLALAAAVAVFPVLLVIGAMVTVPAIGWLMDVGILDPLLPESITLSIAITGAVVLAYLPSRQVYKTLSDRWVTAPRRYCPYCGFNITACADPRCPKCGEPRNSRPPE